MSKRYSKADLHEMMNENNMGYFVEAVETGETDEAYMWVVRDIRNGVIRPSDIIDVSAEIEAALDLEAEEELNSLYY